MAVLEFYDSEPTLETLLEIEGIALIEVDTPSSVVGIGQGVVAVVGEFTKWQPDPTEISGTGEFTEKFGMFSQHVGTKIQTTIGGKVYTGWDGNANLMLSKQKFSRLVCVAVDDSVGTVNITRTNPGFATIESAVEPFSFYGLSSPATLVLRPDETGANDQTANIAFASASHTGGNGAFTSVTNTKKLSITVDGITYQKYANGTDNTQALWIAWFNEPGYFPGLKMIATDADTVKIETDKKGTDASFTIVAAGAGTDAEILTTLSISAGTYSGSGDVADHLAVTAAEVKAVIDADCSTTYMTCTVEGGKVFVSTATEGATGDIECRSSSTADTALGGTFATNEVVTGGTETAPRVVIPAGDIVETAAGVQYQLMQDAVMDEDVLSVTGVKIRAVAATTSTTGQINTFASTYTGDGYVGLAVTNPGNTTARPNTEADWATLYTAALDKLQAQDSPMNEVNIITHCRTAARDNTAASGLIQDAVKEAAISMLGVGTPVIAIVAPPLKTTKTVARGNSAAGVGNLRYKDCVYTYPGVRYFFNQLVTLGIVADGMCDVPHTVALASLMSQIPSNENPGQLTTYLKWQSLESATLSGGTIGPLTTADYKLFKSSGICAPKREGSNKVVQSGVTSVDKDLYPNYVPISQRRYYYFLSKSIGKAVSPYEKKPGTQENRDIVTAIINGFLELQVKQKRLDSYNVDSKSLNTPSMTELNLFRWKISARMFGDMNKIAMYTSVGTSVEVES